MKDIIVTGGSGQLGHCIKDIYIDAYESFTDIRILFPSHYEFDITSPDSMLNYIEDKSPVCIINCAAFTNVNESQFKDDPYIININGVENLTNLCASKDIFLVQISSDYVFNGSPIVKSENNTDELLPVNRYGITKLKAEKIITGSLTKYSIIRTSWLYSKYRQNFVKTIIDKLLNNSVEYVKPIKVVYDQIGSPTYAMDLANFIVKCYIMEFGKDAPGPKSGIFHFSNLGIISWYDFAVAIKEILSKYNSVYDLEDIFPIRTEDLDTSCPRPKISILSKDKVINEFNYKIPYWKKSLENFMYNYITNLFS